MKLLRDFRCHSCGKMTERYIETDANEIRCECGGIALRIIGMPRIDLDGTDPSFPGAYDRWAKVREDNARIKKARSYHGE